MPYSFPNFADVFKSATSRERSHGRAEGRVMRGGNHEGVVGRENGNGETARAMAEITLAHFARNEVWLRF